MIRASAEPPPSPFAAPDPPDLIEQLARSIGLSAQPLVVIDGPSGSGKSELATLLAEHVDDSELVRLDDLYPGWDGLARAGDHISHSLLHPLSQGREGRVRQWDWVRGEPREWRTIRPGHPVIVEGSGALTRAAAPFATLRIWIALEDESERRRRALGRPDGAAYRPQWSRWAAQEARHLAEEDPRGSADIVLRPAAFPGDHRYVLLAGTT